MACFLAPAVEAVVVTIIKKRIEKKEALKFASKPKEIISDNQCGTDFSWSHKLSWLKNLLWGGVFLLAIEHIWHGEVVLWPPFLTAMNSPENIVPMLCEIATVGVSMAVFVTAVWSIMVLGSVYIYRKAATTIPEE
ncbi:MAG: hypothetical protein VB035_00915 [Candidatus Fimivivens sp.]|nr:hypothetical protein [Candidatus Fimivivens sp.]